MYAEFMRQIQIQLSAQDRRKIDAFRSQGLHLAREVNRAHILAALDGGVPDPQIAQVLGVSRVVIWRTRSAFQEKGLEYALHDVPRSGAEPKYSTEHQAEVVALACTEPPAGQKRWTLQSLTVAARKRSALREVSPETIRRWLKKTS
jgi:transposase